MGKHEGLNTRVEMLQKSLKAQEDHRRAKRITEMRKVRTDWTRKEIKARWKREERKLMNKFLRSNKCKQVPALGLENMQTKRACTN